MERFFCRGCLLAKSLRLAFVLTTVIPPATSFATATSGTLYWHSDHLSNLVALSDLSGRVKARIRYEAYGGPVVIANEADAVTVASFTGKRLDGTTGLYYFGARHLDPRLGRFLSADPAKQSKSPYLYAGAAPLINVDLNGTSFDFAEALLYRWSTHGANITPEQGYQLFVDTLRAHEAEQTRITSDSYRQYHLGSRGSARVDLQANAFSEVQRLRFNIAHMERQMIHADLLVDLLADLKAQESAAYEWLRYARWRWRTWYHNASDGHCTGVDRVVSDDKLWQHSQELALQIQAKYAEDGAIPVKDIRRVVNPNAELFSDSSSTHSTGNKSSIYSLSGISDISSISSTYDMRSSGTHYTDMPSPPASSESDDDTEELIQAIERNMNIQ